MAAIGVGASFQALQQLLAPRLAEIASGYTAPMDGLLDEVDRAEHALLQLQQHRADDTTARWARYREGYERYFHDAVEPDPVGTDEPDDRRIWNPVKPIGTGTVGDPVPDGTDLALAAAGPTDGEDAR